jgi:hypothetical protein
MTSISTTYNYCNFSTYFLDQLTFIPDWEAKLSANCCFACSSRTTDWGEVTVATGVTTEVGGGNAAGTCVLNATYKEHT